MAVVRPEAAGMWWLWVAGQSELDPAGYLVAESLSFQKQVECERRYLGPQGTFPEMAGFEIAQGF